MLGTRELEYFSHVATLAEHGDCLARGVVANGKLHDEVYDRLVAIVAAEVYRAVDAATAQKSIATELVFSSR